MAKNWERNLQKELKNAALKEFENWTSNDFINHILELRQQITKFEDQQRPTKTKSQQKEEKPALTQGMFKLDWSFPTKIHFLLALHQKPLTSEDLDQYLTKIDSQYRDYNDPKNNLTTAISRSLKSGRIKKIKQPGIKMLYFVLPEWMDKEGNLKQKFTSFINQFE
ncbi:hypothetical protein CNR22_13445 [Sphingobacteriaceae bacterium]|nr:hypothetical protein CNR22_13445 [Sphingobacteriaceae bacterium]